MMHRRKLLQVAASAASLSLVGLPAKSQSNAVRIGCLNSQNGFTSDYTGVGAIQAARFAVEDFGSKVSGRPIEILTADHQDKADLAVQIAREWFGSGVDVIVGIGNSACSLAVKTVAEQFNKLVIHVGTTTSVLNGASCSANGIQWDLTTYTQTNGLLTPLIKGGKKSFFVMVADYAYGHAIEADAKRIVEQGGGKVLGSVRLPTDSNDYSSFIATAMASGAEVVFIATFPIVSLLKQAAEFGMAQKQTIASPIPSISDINAIGLKSAQGLQLIQGWYWDLNDETRAFAKRFMAARNRAPGDFQAAEYSAVNHYLQGVQQAGSTDAKAVVAAMKAAPINDLFTHGGRINEANKMVFEPYVMQVKSPDESKYPWDYMKVVTKVAVTDAFPDAKDSGCPMAKA